MSIRYKFRSSVNFDALEIGERASIPVWELRTKILKGKTSQQQQQGFDLVFSDADSGLEFKGDDCQIASGSSVIVKRVPAVTMPSAVSHGQAVKKVEIKEYHNPNPGNVQAEEFNELGADLCLEPDLNIPEFNLEFDDNDFLGDGMDQVAGTSRAEYQKQGPSDLSQETPRGCNQFGNERIALPRVDQQIQHNLPASNIPAVPCTNLPVEMKCPLCNSFFKEAMMIPCCQHSFCQKCIHRVLIEKSRCPKCFSSKCRVEDLLPNLSLRQAIEHFLEAEMLDAGFENTLQNYVPDGESGIQAREFSCAPSVVQRELEMPQLSSATGRGSTQVHTEAFLEQRQRNMQFGGSGNKEIRPALPSQKVNQIDGMSGYPRPNDKPSGPEDFVPSADFQGENQPVIPPANVHFEADYNTRRNFMGPGGYRKGVRNCYTCGSPDHLMRDCPMSHPNPMFQPGNGAYHGGMPGYAQPPYWNGSPMPPFRPYPNMYGNPGMMPFNTSMVPVAPFTAPPYFSSMGASMPGPGANVRMGNMGPPRHAEHLGLQPCMNKRKHPHPNEELDRESISEGEDDSPERHRHVTPERSHDQRTRKEDTRSDDSFARRSAGKNQHDKFSHDKVSRPSNSSRDKRSLSGKEDASRSSESRHRHHHHGDSRRHQERKGHCESESSHGYHPAQKDAKRRPHPDARGSSHHSPPSERREYRDRDTGRRDEYRHHKRRVHRE